METKLEQIAAKARREPKLRFSSLAHHITRDRVRKNLLQIPRRSAAGVDGQTVEAAKKSFGAFGADPAWNEAKKTSEKDGRLTADVKSVFMKATDYSPTR